MRRAARILFNAAAAISLLLCVATVAPWVRSYLVSDRLFFQWYEDAQDRSYWAQDTIKCGRGGIGINRIVQSGERFPMLGPGYRAEHQARFGSVPIHGVTEAEYPNFHVGVGDDPVWGGFKRGAYAYADPGHARPRAYGWQVVVPLWAVLGPAVLFPALWGWRWRRLRKGHRAGLCPTCGYDLRATPDRCPECGAVPSAQDARLPKPGG
jgi:4-amino-4-deoxy-L-arabinose transferase-like glycosyltransferase